MLSNIVNGHCTNTFFSILTHYLHFFSLGPYRTTTANVSAVFDTQITPSGWTFNIWSVIYVWLTAMIIYILAGLCRKLRPIVFIFSCLKPENIVNLARIGGC